MKTMQKVQRGFTLIELMIVVAIIGILAALAIPAYQDYTIKSRVGEGASLMGAFKTAMEVYYSENGTLAGPGGAIITAADLEVTTPESEYVSEISIEGSALQPYFVVEYKDSVAIGTAALTCINYYPNKTGANLRWDVRSLTAYTTKGGYAVAAAADCDNAAMPDKYRPKI